MDKKRAALVAVAGGLTIFGVKLVAYFMSGSVALLSDALESIINIAASFLMLFSVYVSGMPADENHQYGHQKVESISSMVEGGFILTAALFIIHTAIERIYRPAALTMVEAALGVSLFATAMNGGLSWLLGRTAKETGSMALEGDAKHLFSDVISSVGVAAGLMVAEITGLYILDPVIALFVSAVILRMGGKLVLKSARGLMDMSAPIEESEIKRVLELHESSFFDFHEVKTRRSGDRVFAELHLSVDGSLTVEEAHELTDHLEEELKEDLPGVTITIHIEPPQGERIRRAESL